MPNARHGLFNPPARASILQELYTALWGNNYSLFLARNELLPQGGLLSEAQARSSHKPADDGVSRACQHVFKKGECCFRCKDCAMDDSCIMCARCFYSTEHAGHVVTFCISQQPGGSCDCGDPEVWRHPINCPHHQNGASTSDSTTKSSDKRAPVPISPNLRDSMARVIGCALDFLLDVLDYSPEDTTLPSSYEALMDQSSADPLQKEYWAIVLWNDEKHSYDEAVAHLQHMTGCNLQQATAVVLRTDDEGRDVIEVAGDAKRLLETAHKISTVDLTVTMRRAFDIFREHMAAVIIEWLLDLLQCHVGGDKHILRELVAAELFSSRRPDSSFLYSEVSKQYPEAHEGGRIEWLFIYHPRLWKRPRLNLKQIYITILTMSQENRLSVAIHYAKMFHRIIDSYLLVDREAETSIKFFALDLFTVPSVAAHLVKECGVLSRLLSVIAGFFTNQISNKRIVFPPDPNHPMDVEAYPFRSKRYMPIFSDIRYICNNHSVQGIISSGTNATSEFAAVCAMFMGIQPNKRARGNHVEYESDSWINVFNVTLSLSRVVKAFGEAFTCASPSALLACIEVVMTQIQRACSMEETRLDPNFYSAPTFHTVSFQGANYRTIEFDVLSGWVSFHNAPHWLLAELLKQASLLESRQTGATHQTVLQSAIAEKFDDATILQIIEFPLRVLALIAQVRAGLWVRNGFPIRGQLVHYRDFMLRELCYDQDLFLLQTAMILIDPNLVLVSMLDRFQLLDWMSGNQAHPECEPTHLAGLVEELLFTLIFCTGDPSNALQLPLEAICKREIVHALAPGPISFTDLCKRVPERLIEEASFEHVLQNVSVFRKAESILDTGSYELKEEFYEEVDPFFYHYTRARREEVEGVLKSKMAKNGSKDLVILPKPYKIPAGPYANLETVLESPVLLQIIFYTIHNFVYGAPLTEGSVSTDAIIDQALHLATLALIQLGPRFTTIARQTRFSDTSLVEMLCEIETRDSSKASRPRIQWCLDCMTEHDPSVREFRQLPEAKPVSDASMEAKKKAAKARQDAIMKQFADAQKMFMETFDEDEEEETSANQPQSEVEEALEPCILCQEKMDSSRPFGTIAAIHPSRLVRYSPPPGTPQWSDVLRSPESLDKELPVVEGDAKADRLTAFPSRYLRFGTYSSTCGHMVHHHCFSDYMEAIRSRHRVQPQRHQPECLERGEFVCPLCKSLGNCLLPVNKATTKPTTRIPPFAEWLRSLGIELLRSTPDRQLERHQFPSGTGEFMFWAAEDTAWPTDPSALGSGDEIASTVRAATAMISRQSAPLRTRPEPMAGERGAGLYIPDGLGAYTLAALEVAYRGVGATGTTRFLQKLPDTAGQCIRGIVGTLNRLAVVQFRSRPTSTFDSMRLAIAKRLLPEWTREEQYRHPFLLRDPCSVLFECAAVAPDFIPNIVCALYYASLLRALFALIQHLLTSSSSHTPSLKSTRHTSFLGSVAVLLKSAARHSPILDRTADRILDTIGEARLEQLLYAHTLPTLRSLLIFAHAVCPWAINPVDESEMSIVAEAQIGANEASAICIRESKSFRFFPSSYPDMLERCSGPIGIYFLLKRCVVLYLYGDSGSFAPPPYVDSHGEIDIGLRRGRRQYLHPVRMEEIRKTWLLNGVPSAVSRRIEVQTDAGGWESL
ncbi:E3 ubiquitin-protein ligase ubr1; AltName: Full=N-end-recognizing protein; AltName: Full=N-recognin-1 [Serendipita indica DSM 11827]|nr:E3 ubiquitin-protein ligase ubr1; AltName: Full=N-end-recognizing protein; AltName: Full=N-recognin-1 [Serendipita indica DSM 11827]